MVVYRTGDAPFRWCQYLIRTECDCELGVLFGSHAGFRNADEVEQLRGVSRDVMVGGGGWWSCVP
jgi:hypothetical protein